LPESRIKAAINEFFKECCNNILEERITDYIVKELRTGRELSEVLTDPYVKDRIGEGHLVHVIGNKELLETYEQRIKKSMKAS